MKLEHGVPKIELCKKLKELGYPQEDSLWYWADCYYGDQDQKEWRIVDPTELIGFCKENTAIAAPTVADLGEKARGNFITRWTQQGWVCQHPLLTEEQCPTIIETIEADARAEMLIFLLENKLIEL